MSGLLTTGFVFRAQLELLLAFAEKHVGHKPGFDATRLLISSAADANPDLVMEQFYSHLQPMEQQLKDRDPAVIAHFETMSFFKGLGLSHEYVRSEPADQIELWSLLTTLYFLAMQAGDIGSAIAGNLTGMMEQLGVDVNLRAPGAKSEIEAYMANVAPRLADFIPIMAGLSNDLDRAGSAGSVTSQEIPLDFVASLTQGASAGSGGTGHRTRRASIQSLDDTSSGDGGPPADEYSQLF